MKSALYKSSRFLLVFSLLFGFDLATAREALEEIGARVSSSENREEQKTDEEMPTIKVGVSLVPVDVTVLGANVPDLRSEDFIVRDNDQIQEVCHFSRDQIPLAIAIVIDRSSSIRHYLPLLQKAATSALARLKPEDQVALFAFDDDILKLSDLTSHHKLIADIVGKLTIGSGTGVYDAVFRTARYLRINAPYSRRAIIFVSDGCHTSAGGIDKEEAEIEVLETGATFYGIQTPGENHVPGKRVNDASCRSSIDLMRKLASETGGDMLNVNAVGSLQEALEKAISGLRMQYTLGFNPTETAESGSYHQLTVNLASADRCRECRLLARRGYYSGASAPIFSVKKNRPTSSDIIAETDLTQIRRIMNNAETIDYSLPDIPITAKATSQTAPNGMPQFKLDLRVNFTHVSFQKVENHRECRLHIAIFSIGPKGNILASDWRTLDGVLSEDTYGRVMKDGWAFSTLIPAVGSRVVLRIVAYDEGSDSLGSTLLNLGQAAAEEEKRLSSVSRQPQY